MKVNELIAALQRLADLGSGECDVAVCGADGRAWVPPALVGRSDAESNLVTIGAEGFVLRSELVHFDAST